MLSVGEPAPDFALVDQHGDTVTLSEFEGQWVVVYFYPRADTPGCTTEACGFRDMGGQYQEENIVVLGISDDPVDDIKAFAEKYDLAFHLLSDESGEAASRYDAYGTKNVFGNVVEGVYRRTYIVNPAGAVAATFGRVSPDGHADEVLTAISEAKTT